MYFAVSSRYKEDGEIWTFSKSDYVRLGTEQWERWPETTIDSSGKPEMFDAKVTAFTIDEPRADWIIAAFYPDGFPRQNAQRGAYTMTARFDVDHADALARLLVEPTRYHRYVINANHKQALQEILRKDHGIWQGSLYPDSAGAAETAGAIFR